MPTAKDYIIAVTPLTNKVWICKTSKRDSDVMTDDRVEVDRNHFIGVVLQWVANQLKEGDDILNITIGKNIVAEIKIDREKLGV